MLLNRATTSLEATTAWWKLGSWNTAVWISEPFLSDIILFLHSGILALHSCFALGINLMVKVFNI